MFDRIYRETQQLFLFQYDYVIREHALLEYQKQLTQQVQQAQQAQQVLHPIGYNTQQKKKVTDPVIKKPACFGWNTNTDLFGDFLSTVHSFSSNEKETPVANEMKEAVASVETPVVSVETPVANEIKEADISFDQAESTSNDTESDEETEFDLEEEESTEKQVKQTENVFGGSISKKKTVKPLIEIQPNNKKIGSSFLHKTDGDPDLAQRLKKIPNHSSRNKAKSKKQLQKESRLTLSNIVKSCKLDKENKQTQDQGQSHQSKDKKAEKYAKYIKKQIKKLKH